MARLLEVLQALGVQGEMGRSGRWIRFQQGPCTAYVVEAAWGEGYAVFCDVPNDDPRCADPQANGVTLILDPVRAIETCVHEMGARLAGIGDPYQKTVVRAI